MEKNKKNLLLYLFSQAISKIGSSILDFAIIWSMVLYNKSSTPFVISILITYLPKVLIVYFLDKIKINKKHKLMMNIGDIITALFSISLLYVNIQNLYLVYFIIFMRSVGVGIMEPYSNSIIVHLFNDKHYYKKANALNSLINSTTSLVIPMLTAFILNYYSIKYIAVIDFITATLSIIMVYNLFIISNEKAENHYVKVKLNNLAKKMLLINFTFYFFMTIPAFMTALLVKYYFGDNIDYLKYNEMFWTAGMIIGSYIVIKLKLTNKNYFSYSIILFGISIIILSISSNIAIYLIVILLSGITFPFYTTTNKLIIQKNMNKSENETYFLKESKYTNISIPFAMIVFGFVINYISINKAFLASGIIIVLLGIFCLLKVLKFEKIRL